MKPIKLLLLLCASVYFVACTNNPSATEATTEATPEVKLLSPVFNADSAFAYVKAQVDFGPRIPSTPAHAACATYLKNKLSSFGAKVQIQEASVKTYDGKSHQLKNIIASINPDKAERILISAHWDTRPFSDQDGDAANHDKPFDGANDGGSGVGVILELARQLQLKESNIGVDFILWDIEDYGKANDETPNETTWCIGSQYWSKNPHVNGYKARYAINLDMVGGSDAQFTMDEVSRTYAPTVLQKVWGIADEIGYTKYFLNLNSGKLVDDHYWVNQAGIPCIDIIDYNNNSGFYKNWHTQFDNLNHIDRNTLKAVGQVVLETIFREAASK